MKNSFAFSLCISLGFVSWYIKALQCSEYEHNTETFAHYPSGYRALWLHNPTPAGFVFSVCVIGYWNAESSRWVPGTGGTLFCLVLIREVEMVWQPRLEASKDQSRRERDTGTVEGNPDVDPCPLLQDFPPVWLKPHGVILQSQHFVCTYLIDNHKVRQPKYPRGIGQHLKMKVETLNKISSHLQSQRT